jgi:hypothetical protein
MSSKHVGVVVFKTKACMQLAMYLRQKNVEERIVAWIQAACMYMIYGVCWKSVEGCDDNSEAQAVLKRQQD